MLMIMQRKRTKRRIRRRIYNTAVKNNGFVLYSLLLNLWWIWEKNLALLSPLQVVMVKGMITSPSSRVNQFYSSRLPSSRDNFQLSDNIPSSDHRRQRRRRTRNWVRNDGTMLGDSVRRNQPTTSFVDDIDVTVSDNCWKNKTLDGKLMNTLWSYVHNLQRSRKTKGDKKAADSLASYLQSNKVDEKINPNHFKVDFDEIETKYDVHNNHNHHIIDKAEETSNTLKLLSSLQEVMERALIPALRQAGECNDYKMILRLVSGSVSFANCHPILRPRIFGEAFNALSQTQANIAKIKSVWNIMIGKTENGKAYHRPLFLVSSPTAFELNIFLKSIAKRGKSTACIEFYKQYCIPEGSSVSAGTPTSSIYIRPDPYTISILLSILADSVSIDQNMYNPVPKTTNITITTNSTKSLWEKLKHLSSSTCWQWNAAVDLVGTLPNGDNYNDEQNKNYTHDDMYKTSSKNETLSWRNNHVYSSLLKLQEKAQDICNRRRDTDVSYHKNGAELTMVILNDMIAHDIVPDEVTCTQAIKAMANAVGSNGIVRQNTAMPVTALADNIAVDFLEQMKSNNKLPNPNQYSYSEVIKICAQMKNHRTALRLLEEMRNDYYSKSNIDGDGTASSHPPNTWVYNAALLSLDNRKRMHLNPTANTRRRNKWVDKLWDQRNQEMNQQQRTDAALNLLDQMKYDHENFNLDTKPDTVTYNTILGIGTFDSKKEKRSGSQGTEILLERSILSIIDQMKNEGVDRDEITYRNSIDASTSSEEVMAILRQSLYDMCIIDRKEQDCSSKSALTSIFNSGLSTSRFWQNVELFKGILKLILEQGIEMNDQTLTSIISFIGLNGKRESLACFIELIDSRDDQDSLIESTRTQQEHLKSIGVIDGMDIVRKIPMLAEFHYSQAIEICLKSNDFNHANNILTKMRDKGIHPTTGCMEGFALAYAQAAMENSGKSYRDNVSSVDTGTLSSSSHSYSLSRAYSAYKISQTLARPKTSTLCKIARSLSCTGQFKLCRGLLRSIHNDVLSSNKDFDDPHMIDYLRSTHSFILRECAKRGNLSSALWYTNDIQEFSSKIHSKYQGNRDETLLPQFSKSALEEDDTFFNLRLFADVKSNINVNMQPNDWITLIRVASKAGRWQVCVKTLQFLRPYVERTNPSNLDDILNESVRDRYNHLTPALTAVTRSLESHSQFAWSIRVIEDWIEWSGRKPRIEAALSTIRALSANGCIEEIRSLVDTCSQKDLSHSGAKKDSNYEELIYVGAITSLHSNGLYDDADEIFMLGVQDGFLPFYCIRENDQFILDLHGLNVALAHSAVRIAMRQYSATLSEETTQSNMMIITGKGRNSEMHLRPILRPEVQRMLLEEFYPPLNTMSIPGNMGALTILGPDIEAWQEHQQKQKGVRMLELAGLLRNLSSQDRLKKTIISSLKSNNNN